MCVYVCMCVCMYVCVCVCVCVCTSIGLVGVRPQLIVNADDVLTQTNKRAVENIIAVITNPNHHQKTITFHESLM